MMVLVFLYLATLHHFQPGLHLVLSVAAGISCCSQVDISLCSDLQQTYPLDPYSNFGLELRLQYCSYMEVEVSPKISQHVYE